MRIHTFLLAAGVVLAACSGGEEAGPSEPIVDDNPGRDIAIPRSVADGVRLSRVSIDRPDSKTRYFFFNYDEEGWLVSGGMRPDNLIFDVVGRMDTIKVRPDYSKNPQYHLIYDIKRNGDGHITSLTREFGDPYEYYVDYFLLAKENVAARFHYDAEMQLTGFEEAGEQWYAKVGDTLRCNYKGSVAYEYEGDAIRRITSRHEFVPARDSIAVETVVVDFAGEEVENRHGTFDFFASALGHSVYRPLRMTGYMGEWARRIPGKVSCLRSGVDDSGREVYRMEEEYDLMLECDENGRLTAERGKYFIYLE